MISEGSDETVCHWGSPTRAFAVRTHKVGETLTQANDYLVSLESCTCSFYHYPVSHFQPASETPFKWRFADGPIAAHYCILMCISTKPFELIESSFSDFTVRIKLSK